MTLALRETAGTEEFSTIRTFRPLGSVSLCTSKVGRSPRSVGFNIGLLRNVFGSVAQKKAYGSIVFVEISIAHAGKLLARDVINIPDIRVNVVERADGLHLPEQNGLVERSFARKDKVRFDLVLRAIKFCGSNAGCDHVFQLAVDTCFDFINRMLAPRLRTNMEERGIFGFTEFCRNKHHRLLAFDHALI